MVLTGVLVTHELSDEALGWFLSFRKLVDEFVVFADRDPASEDLKQKLRALDARLVPISGHGGAIYKADLGAMLAECHGDWIFKVDYDEELSAEWHDPRWRKILAGEQTHFWSPRRWITAPGKYITHAPWWPDWQMRLFRNLPDQIRFPEQLHEHLRISGPAGFLRTLALHHHALRILPRTLREEKVTAYEKQRPGHGLGLFYLPENYAPREAPLPGVSDFDPARELLPMARLNDDEVALLHIDAERPPRQAQASRFFWLRVNVQNNCDHAVGVGAPFPLNLSYHWLEHASREVLVFDGERTALLPQIEPGQAATFWMFVITPAAPGEYLLQITLVQEGVRWLDGSGSPTVQDFPVSISG